MTEAADFHEEDHPREEHGKFTSTGGGTAKKGTPAKPKGGKRVEPTKGELKKSFDKAKKKSVTYLTKDIKREKTADKTNVEKGWVSQYSGFSEKDMTKLNALKGFPENSNDIEGLSTTVKGYLMKEELSTRFPGSKWSARASHFSGGSSIDTQWKGGGTYPYGSSEIGRKYHHDYGSDPQTDYFHVDDWVHVYDGRTEKDPRDPQTMATSRADRLQGWIRDDLNASAERIDYNDSVNWSSTSAKDLAEKGEFTPFVGMTEDHKARITQTWKEFQAKEEAEGGIGSTADSGFVALPPAPEEANPYDNGGEPDPEPIPASTPEPEPTPEPTSEPTNDAERAGMQMRQQKKEPGSQYEWQKGQESLDDLIDKLDALNGE